MADKTRPTELRPMPVAASHKLLSPEDGVAKMPTIAEAAGTTGLNSYDKLRVLMKESKLNRKAREEVRAEATRMATDIVLYKLSQDETYIKSKILVENEERNGALTSQVTEMVSQAIKLHTRHVFDFNLTLGEEEAEFIHLLNERLKAGKITQDRYDKSMSKLSSVIEKDLDRAELVFEQLIEDVITNFKALSQR